MLKPSPHAAENLETYLNRFCKYVVGLRPDGSEDREAFAKRRNSAVASLKRETKFDVRARWALKLATWVEHMYRHPQKPAYQFIHVQTDDWLREQRRSIGKFGKSRSEDAGETATRAGPGTPHRWGSKWVEFVAESEYGWQNPDKSKSDSRLRAELIRHNFLCRPARALAIRDA